MFEWRRIVKGLIHRGAYLRAFLYSPQNLLVFELLRYVSSWKVASSVAKYEFGLRVRAHDAHHFFVACRR